MRYFASLVGSRNLGSVGAANVVELLELESAILQESVERVRLRLSKFESAAFCGLFLFSVRLGSLQALLRASRSSTQVVRPTQQRANRHRHVANGRHFRFHQVATFTFHAFSSALQVRQETRQNGF